MTMLETIGSVLTSMIGWIGDVVSAIFSADGALSVLAPLFFIGVTVSLVLLGVKVVKSLIWGA